MIEAEEDIKSQYAAAPVVGTEVAPRLVLGACSGVAISDLFSREDHQVASQVVRENGGSIVLPQAADYLLAPLKGAGTEVGMVKGALVTMIWLVCSTL